MSQPITKKHLTAISLHISDVLGDTDTTRATEVLDAMGLGPTSTYATLAAITQAVVTEALTDAGVKIPSLRRGTITALFGFVRPGTLTCNRCGRLPIALVDVAWSPVTVTLCPHDSGLYEAEMVVVVRSWVDGREYPAGTKTTPDRIPLTEEGIRERGVSALVLSACRETGTTLLDVLSALVAKGLTPVGALAMVRDPFSLDLFIDADALREFAQGARGAFAAMGSRTALPAPTSRGASTVTVQSWGRLSGGEWKALQTALVSAFPTIDDLGRLLKFEFGVNIEAICSGNLLERVYTIIQWSQSHGKTFELFQAARRQNPGNMDLRNLDR